MMMNGAYGFGGWGIFGMLFHLAIVLIVIYFMVYFIKSISKTNTSNDHPDRKTGLQIIEERFAQGEINEEEFTQKKRLLQD